MKLTHGNGIIAIILGMSLQMGNTWRRWTLLILMGSKEDTLQSTLNKGNPMWECCQTVFCGVVSRDTIVVRSHGFLESLDGAFNFRESESMKKNPVGALFHW